MKNDYKKYQFWVKKINNKKIWYIRIKNQWVEVDKEVYAVCTNSYQKMNYEIKKDKNNSNYSDINNIDLYGHYFEVDYIDVIYQEDLKKKIYTVLQKLNEDDFYIISSIYFFDMKENEVAKKLGMSQQKLNYHKKIILKEIKKILLK